MVRQGVTSDKAEEHFDDSSGINLIVLARFWVTSMQTAVWVHILCYLTRTL